MKPCAILVFPSQLGWMAVRVAGAVVQQLTFGHPTAAAARAAVSKGRGDVVGEAGGRLQTLVHRLQAYASGTPERFRDVRIDSGPASEFQRRVLTVCRRVRYGTTVSYAELATRSGYPGAARAVGNCMAANRIPLIIPCHRVVCADGRLGSYSARGGARMKRRLLALESGKLT